MIIHSNCDRGTLTKETIQVSKVKYNNTSKIIKTKKLNFKIKLGLELVKLIKNTSDFLKAKIFLHYNTFHFKVFKIVSGKLVLCFEMWQSQLLL